MALSKTGSRWGGEALRLSVGSARKKAEAYRENGASFTHCFCRKEKEKGMDTNAKSNQESMETSVIEILKRVTHALFLEFVCQYSKSPEVSGGVPFKICIEGEKSYLCTGIDISLSDPSSFVVELQFADEELAETGNLQNQCGWCVRDLRNASGVRTTTGSVYKIDMPREGGFHEQHLETHSHTYWREREFNGGGSVRISGIDFPVD